MRQVHLPLGPCGSCFGPLAMVLRAAPSQPSWIQVIDSGAMPLLNVWVRLRTASAAIALLALAACGGGAETVQTAPATTPTPTAPTTNTAPTIAGQPGSSILAGQTYSFQPSASDANGDSLTFSAANVPAWASFNFSTGRLTGTPSAGDVGSYSGITITVSDGKATASLGPFSVTVNAIASGSASLLWVPPTLNADGTVLTDLAGYQILYGPSADNLSQIITVQNPSVSTYIVENLTAGSWYFAVVAVNSSGASSTLSNIASKKIG